MEVEVEVEVEKKRRMVEYSEELMQGISRDLTNIEKKLFRLKELADGDIVNQTSSMRISHIMVVVNDLRRDILVIMAEIFRKYQLSFVNFYRISNTGKQEADKCPTKKGVNIGEHINNSKRLGLG